MALTDNLVAYYKLDEASGNATDETANALHLTDNNSVGAGSGKLNGARDFERSGVQSFSHVDDALYDFGTGDFACSLWVNLESTGITQAFAGQFLDSNSTGWTVYVFTDNKVYFDTGAAGAFTSAGSTSTLSASTWCHIVAQRNSGVLELWLDGVQEDTDSGTVRNINNTDAFRLGVLVGGGSPLDGLMDEVGLWSRGLSSGEIGTLYGGGTPPAYPFAGGGGGRTTKNTRSAPLGVAIGMGWRM